MNKPEGDDDEFDFGGGGDSRPEVGDSYPDRGDYDDAGEDERGQSREEEDEAGGATDTDDDEPEDDPADVIREFGSHKLMERAQKAYIKQLKDAQDRLKGELNLKEEEIKRVTNDRETLGVQLYALQQQLAGLQISLESGHNEYNSLVDAKIQEESLLKSVMANNLEQKALLEEHQGQHKKCLSELDGLNETLRQIEQYNNEIKSEIALTRRATYKAEQSMQQLEKGKNDQDLLVDSLNKRAKDLNEQIAMYRSQLEAQTTETADANGVLQDTVKELELIAHEKRQLMSQWKSALNGLSRRDEALAQIQDTLKVAEMAVHDYDMEIDGLRRRVQQEQERNETLVTARDRVENDLKFVEETLAKMRTEKEQLNERYTLLTKSLAQTDSETKKLVLAGKVLNSDAESLFAALQTVTAERQRLEDEIIIAKSNHSNINKAVENLLREQGKMQKKIHEKENEAVDVENEIAEAKVQCLNQASLNDQVKEQLNQVAVDLKSKESLVEKYQIEIRQRNDDIEKKMYRVDRLNKKYNKMIESAGGEENLGPMENTIRLLNKEIENTVNECKELERDWLRRQTELVTIAAEEQKLSDENAENQARVTVLLRQQLRYTKALSTLKAELKAAQANNVDLQKDVARINSLISANNNEESSLKNDNFALEIECMEELKSLERESVSLQSSILQAKSDKESMMEQIVDMERQALLWEKKIQLDKQTKEALDPTVGQQETQDMEREVHRMGLRLEALKRECERLSIEMERAVTKRSTIELRFKGKDTSAGTSRSMTSLSSTSSSSKGADKASMELTQAGIKKKITNLKKDARSLSDETTKYLGVIDERKNQLSQIAAELEELNNACAESERSNIDMQRQINDMLYQKQRNQERISYAQTYLKKLREYLNGNSETLNGLQAERRLLTANQALENVRDIIRDVQRIHPHLDDILERVFNMSDPGSDLVQL